MTQPANPQLLDAERRSWDYWFSDGLASIVSGFACLFMAVYLVSSRRFLHGYLFGAVLILCMLLYGVVIIFQRQIIEWLKSKITYPRTGYAAPPYFTEDRTMPVDLTVLSMDGADAKNPNDIERVRRDRKLRAAFVVVLAVGITLLAVLVTNPWIYAVVGVGVAAVLWIFGRKDQRISWVILAGLPFVGFYLAIFQIPRRERLGYFLLGASLLLIAQGLLALRRYIRRNPRQGALHA